MNFFAQRRQELWSLMPDKSLALIPAAQLATRSNDTEYKFRQNSNFWYVTGFNEPDALVVLAKGLGAEKQLLFNQPKDELLETWTGLRLGQEKAVTELGFCAAFSIQETSQHLPELIAQAQEVWLPLENLELYQDFLSWRKQARALRKRQAVLPNKLQDLEQILGQMRLIKQPEEIQLLRQAAQISAAGHVRAMQACQAGMYEYELEAELEYEFRRQGASAPAYASIVGGGANACVLHYVENSSQLQAGDLVLIDAGAEFQGYAGDITRTFPVNGKFSPQQLQVYNLVLEANELAISLAKPGATLEQLHQAVIHCLTSGLVQLGLLQGEVGALIQAQKYQQFFMHGTSHWLGLDVHDAGLYMQDGKARVLEEGMVFTIEPGLYIAPTTQGLDPSWLGIGVRIEDDVLITASGCEVLTTSVPKEAAAIEALMAGA